MAVASLMTARRTLTDFSNPPTNNYHFLSGPQIVPTDLSDYFKSWNPVANEMSAFTASIQHHFGLGQLQGQGQGHAGQGQLPSCLLTTSPNPSVTPGGGGEADDLKPEPESLAIPEISFPSLDFPSVVVKGR